MPDAERQREEVIRSSERVAGSGTGEVRSGYIRRLNGAPVLVDFEVVDGQAVFEGDIILGRADEIEGLPDSTESTTRGLVITGDRFRWQNGVVPFTIEANLPDQSRVTSAIQHWQQKTGVRFVNRTNQANFLTFRPANECSSSVGQRGGQQFVNLGSGCTTGNCIHEIGHSVGLWHEQGREDRNKFVTIDFSNIQDGQEHNFNQHISDGDDVGNYDYGSIMHYGAFAFAKDTSKPTIVAPQPIGQRTGLSAGDIAAVKSMYYFKREGDSADLAGATSEIAAAKFGTHGVVTAVRTGSGTLKLITWSVAAGGAVSRLHDSGDAAGAASQIAIADARYHVTVCRTGDGNQKLISWQISDAGAIVRKGDSGDAAGAATLNRIVALSDTLIVTACRNGSGNLQLISWRVNENGSISRLRDASAGAVSEISMVRLSSSRLATAVRAGDGTLLVIAWDVNASGAITRKGDSHGAAGDARMIRAVRAGSGDLLTSVRDGGGDLKLISWRIASDGGVARLHDSGDAAGGIGDNALMARAPGVISAVRAADGHLKLIAWEVTASGAINRKGDSYNLAGEASVITFCPESLASEGAIVTACRAADGSLKLISWSD
jgi:astacin